MCHNEIRDKIFYLSQRAFNSLSVRAEPLIHQGRTRSEIEIRQGGEKHNYTRGYVMIQGLWDHQVDTIIDVNIGDSDADMYKHESMISLLERWENIKNDKHVNHCHIQRKDFSAFVLSVDGILDREALVVLSQFS